MNFRRLKIIHNTSYEIVIVFRIVKIQLTAALNAILSLWICLLAPKI